MALSEQDAALLDEAGFVGDPSAATSARDRHRRRMRDLVSHSLSVTEAAERLGVSTSEVRQRLAAGTLWAFSSEEGQRLPGGQFTATGAVPHLEKLMPLLAMDLHPLSMQALLTTPQPQLIFGGRAVSIAQWLTSNAGIEQAVGVLDAAAWASA